MLSSLCCSCLLQNSVFPVVLVYSRVLRLKDFILGWSEVLLSFSSFLLTAKGCLLSCLCLQLSVVDIDILVGRSLASSIEKSYPLLEAAIRDVMFASMITFSKSCRQSSSYVSFTACPAYCCLLLYVSSGNSAPEGTHMKLISTLKVLQDVSTKMVRGVNVSHYNGHFLVDVGRPSSVGSKLPSQWQYNVVMALARAVYCCSKDVRQFTVVEMCCSLCDKPACLIC